ncbi:MAG TPA: hypothetical protein VF062_18835 [Candidatus Limnocylindrales bacterium]
MTAHSFVDESKESTYLLVAALIRPANVASIRQAVAGMVLPRQRRIHFCQEKDSRRSQIIGRLVEMPVEAVIYEARDKANEKDSREPLPSGAHPRPSGTRCQTPGVGT